MEFHNFSDAEVDILNKGLKFIGNKDINPTVLPDDLMIIKTDDYTNCWEEFIYPEENIGTEDIYGRLILPNPKMDKYVILLNKETIKGLSYAQTLTHQFIHLADFIEYSEENGNPYRLTNEELVDSFYYEFLLWTKFHAKKISVRSFALLSWHQVNGDAPPENGQYQFQDIDFNTQALGKGIIAIDNNKNSAQLREEFWGLLLDLVFYFGRLSVYQNTADPAALDENFSGDDLDRVVGPGNWFSLYQLLQSTINYTQWQQKKGAIRDLIVNMEEYLKNH